MAELTQTGDFRGTIRSYKLEEYKSKAIAIAVLADVHDVWNPETGGWEDWREHRLQVRGYLFIVKKNGQLNDTQISALVTHTGWDGNLESVSRGTWKATPFQFTVEENRYKDNVDYRIGWLNGYDDEPGGGKVDQNRAKELQARFGSMLRAVTGNAVRNQPAEKPVDTLADAPVDAPVEAMTPTPEEKAADDIPF